jgi:hypothetical protein
LRSPEGTNPNEAEPEIAPEPFRSPDGVNDIGISPNNAPDPFKSPEGVKPNDIVPEIAPAGAFENMKTFFGLLYG